MLLGVKSFNFAKKTKMRIKAEFIHNLKYSKHIISSLELKDHIKLY